MYLLRSVLALSRGSADAVGGWQDGAVELTRMPISTGKKTVFILGAGASAEAGVPLMKDFLDVAHDLRRSGLIHGFQADYDAVFGAIDALQGVFAKSYLDLQNVESVFAAFEMGALLGRLGSLDPKKIPDASHHMRRLILSVVQETTIFNPGQIQQPYLPPQPYESFVSLLEELHRKKHQLTVISFNYDLALDYALAWRTLAPQFVNLGEKVLKLHGSLHWYRCSNDKCNHVNELSFTNMYHNSNMYFFRAPNGLRLRLLENDKIPNSPNCSACNESLALEPLIVPPTWSKTQYYKDIAHVWRDAAHELSEAENIFVCGYSLPDTDVFFRYLFAIGTTGHHLLRRFWVFNPNSSLEDRFRTLLGAGVMNRFQFFPKTFAQSFSVIQNALQGEL